jgi:exopolyphosphatase/pppGpp-phosphohydrolase
MPEQFSPARAAIDIGSNTLHIVIARSTPDTLDIVDDQVDMVRIGESVDANGEISPQKCDTAISVLKKYNDAAEKHKAEKIFTVATEAIRKASNSSNFLKQVKQETGLDVQIISGTAEATFTFFGATYELNNNPNAPAQVGVVDLGGGSMELITAKNRQITWQTSIQIGSGWLHDRYLPSDPPTREQIDVARTFLRTYLNGMRIKQTPRMFVVTGGSANSLLFMARKALRLDPATHQLTRDDLGRCEVLLSTLPAEEIAERYDQPLERARILLAGALVIEEVMGRFGLNEITVSEHGIREGVLIAYARYGEEWLNYAEHRANTGKSQNPQDEPFVQSAQRMLTDRTQKMLEWPAEIQKHQDIEAVHKMRVASRRLRATLDAYESCCDPKLYKKVYREIKKAADILGAVRDTDVMLQHLHEQLEQAPQEDRPGVQWFIDRISAYRRDREQELDNFLQSFDGAGLKQDIDSALKKGAGSNGKS